jgi:UDP-2,4-diacetamido-2,4,6-trideoxy-beta-L-altropyranose hydrolase
MPRFLFRLDVSPQVGMGHLRRCQTLALELKRRGAELYFLCRTQDVDISGYLRPVAADWSFCDWSLTPEEDAREVIRSCRTNRIDLVIVDHYHADSAYQKILYESGLRWLQFDGAANYPLWADWVLNMSPGARKTLYDPLRQREKTCFLLGPRYAILREEFHLQHPRMKDCGPVQSILLTFGGGNDRGATISCLEAIHPFKEDIEWIILLSSMNPHKDDILRWGRDGGLKIRIILDAEETAAHMAAADLAITAGGMTTFETAALGVPAMILQIADNQAAIARAWQQCGYAINLGPLDCLQPEILRQELYALMADGERRKAMSEAGLFLVDGQGTGRVAQVLLSV